MIEMPEWRDRLTNQEKRRKEVQKGKESYEGKEKFEEKALETIYKCYGQSKSHNEIIDDLRNKQTVVLLSNPKFLMYLFLFILFAFFLILLLILLPLVDLEAVYGGPFDFEFTGLHLSIIIVTMIFILFGTCGWLIILAIQSKKRFIILDSHGIYYKKISKSRFFAWIDISKITAKDKHNKYGTLNHIVVRIHLTSKGKVRFNSAYYRQHGLRGGVNHKSFVNNFDLFPHRKCPFFYYDRLGGLISRS